MTWPMSITSTCSTFTSGRRGWTSRSLTFFTSRPRLWETWQMAKAFGTRPSAFYGLTDEAEGWFALSVDRATWTWGTTVERWQNETVEVAAPKPPKNAPHMTQKPKHSPELIWSRIYGPLPTDTPVAQPQAAPSKGFVDPRLVMAEAQDDDYVPEKYRNVDLDRLIAEMPKGER
jgi:hypothetical protein